MTKPRGESSNQSTKELLMGKPAKPAGVHKSLGNGGRGNCWRMCPTQIKHHTRNSRKIRPRKRDQHRWQANHVPGKSRGIGCKEGFKSNLVLIQVEDKEASEGMSSRGKKKLARYLMGFIRKLYWEALHRAIEGNLKIF